MALNELSPITQRSASTRFDLPQPFGPTTPVRPGSILNSAASQKLLKPVRRKRSNFIAATLRPGGRAASRDPARPSTSPNSASRQRDAMRTSGHIGAAQSTPAARETCAKRAHCAGGARISSNLSSVCSPSSSLAVDEEGRRRVDLELRGGGVALRVDLVEQRLVLEAGVEIGLRQAGGDDLLLEVDERIGGEGPVRLTGRTGGRPARRASPGRRSGRA